MTPDADASYDQYPNRSPDPLLERSPIMAGRQPHVAAIRTAIADTTGRCYALYFIGPGGVGKTRLLEEVRNIQNGWTGAPFQPTDIIDLSQDRFYSSIGLYQEIANRLDPDNTRFPRYRGQHEKIAEQRKEDPIAKGLQDALGTLDSLWLEEYGALAAQSRIVLCFDTMERIYRESESVLSQFQPRDVDISSKRWFLNAAVRFPNTVILLAGRDRPQLQDEFKKAFGGEGWIFDPRPVPALSAQEVEEYLESKAKWYPALKDSLQSARDICARYAGGLPIRIDIVVDLMLHGDMPRGEEPIDTYLLQRLLHLPQKHSMVMRYLLYARKGLDAGLLRYLVSRPPLEEEIPELVLPSPWTEGDIQKSLEEMAERTIVKHTGGVASQTKAASQPEPLQLDNSPLASTSDVQTEPASQPKPLLLTLHDELYDIWERSQGDLHKSDLPKDEREYTRIVEYYREQVKIAPPDQRENLMIASLYYELHVDARAGLYLYHRYHALWEDEEIKRHEPEFDQRLSEELYQFIYRYTIQFKDRKIIASGISTADFMRAAAVHEVQRLLDRSAPERARERADELLNSELPELDWEQMDDRLYKSSLLTTKAEAMMYTGAPEEEVRKVLAHAIRLLQEDEANSRVA